MSQEQPVLTPEKLAEIELDRRRYLATARIFGGIPTSVDHQRILMRSSPGTQLSISSSSAQPDSAQLQSLGRHSPRLIDTKIKICSVKRERWYEFTAKFDTQTPDNWMSTVVAECLGEQPKTIPASTFITFSGETLASSKIFQKVKWGAMGTDRQSRVADFRLAPEGAPFEILFGSDFINAYQIFTFNPANLILAKKKETKEEKERTAAREAQTETEAEELERERQSNTGAGTSVNQQHQQEKREGKEKGGKGRRRAGRRKGQRKVEERLRKS